MLPEDCLNVSVIIPVYNGGPDFKTCLQSIAAADPSPYEIIVVADGCTDDSEQVAENFGVRLIQTNHPIGSAGARNQGAVVAQGDILLFVDADVAIETDTIARITSYFYDDIHLAAVFGSYDDAPAKQNFLSQYKNLFHHFTHQTADAQAVTFWTACGAVRQEVFNQLQGFDEVLFSSKGKLRSGTIEDIDLGYRLTRAGYGIRLAKEITVKHLKRWNMFSLLYTDIFLRALPWTHLILRDGFFPSTLNLNRSNRASIAALYLALVALCLGRINPSSYLLGSCLMLFVTLANIDLYRFFKNSRGWLFTSAALLWHWFYLLYSGASFFCGVLAHLFQKTILFYQQRLLTHGRWFVPVLSLLSMAALFKLGNEFWRLLFDTSTIGAIDLQLRHNELHQWFAGQTLRHPVYPPASYVLLWPLLGWSGMMVSRWIFALLAVLTFVGLVWLLVRVSQVKTVQEKVFVALLLLSMNATGVTIGNGQLGLLVSFFLLAGLVLLQHKPGNWLYDTLGALCFLFGLVKPGIAAPFFWIALLQTGRLRPAILIILGYCGLTAWGAIFQDAGMVELMHTWLARSIKAAAYASAHRGHSNIHNWLAYAGISQANTLISVILLAASGFWTFVYRRTSLWLQMGLCAMVALIWIHHGLYDDVILIFATIALFFAGKNENSASLLRGSALALLTAAVAVMLMPARILNLWAAPWPFIFEAAHSLTRIAILVFLLKYAGIENKKRLKARSHE